MIYDKKVMKLNRPDTYDRPDQTVEVHSTTRKNTPITIEIQVWRDRLLRGSRKFKGHKHRFNLNRILVFDQKTKLLLILIFKNQTQ